MKVCDLTILSFANQPFFIRLHGKVPVTIYIIVIVFNMLLCIVLYPFLNI